MNYQSFFRSELDALKSDGNYRHFAELERQNGAFPIARCHQTEGDVTIWCSNDYLGMGQHPDVIGAMHDALYQAARMLTHGGFPTHQKSDSIVVCLGGRDHGCGD